MKESEHRYIEGASLEAPEDLYEDQIKLNKEADETGSIEIKESKDKFIASVSLEAQEQITDNEVKVELVVMPGVLAPTVLPEMPQLCNVYAEQVVIELPSTSNFEIPINNEDINLETVASQPKELIDLEKEPRKDEMVDRIHTADLIKLNEPKEVEGVTLDAVGESYNLETVDLTPEELIEFKVEPKEVEGVSLDVEKELYSLETDLTPEEFIEMKVEPKEVEGVSLNVQGELYNLDTVDFTPEDLIEVEVEPKEVEGVNLDFQGELYNLDTVDPTPEDLIEIKVEAKEVQGVSLDVQGELCNLETIDLMAEELKVEAKEPEGLYEDHEVIDEMVLGPVGLTRPDVMYTRQEVPIETEAPWEIPIHYEMKEEPNIGYIDVVNFHAQTGYVDDVRNGLLGPEILQAVDFYIKQALVQRAGGACTVRLERIHVDTRRRTCRVGHTTYKLRGVVPYRKKGFRFNLGKARLAIQDKLNNINKHTRPQTPPPSNNVIVVGPPLGKSAFCESGYPPTASNAYFHSRSQELPSKIVLVSGPQRKKSAKCEPGYLPDASNALSTQTPKIPPKNAITVVPSRIVKRRYSNFKCYVCAETFKTKLSLKEHKSKVHGIKKFNHELDNMNLWKRVKSKPAKNVAPQLTGGSWGRGTQSPRGPRRTTPE